MPQASSLERLMLDLINEERRSAGLDPLTLDLRLNASSEDHSEWMLERDVFSHTGEGGSTAHERMNEAGFAFEGRWASGENIAWQSERGAPGLEDDVADLHQSLMNSPGHRANILNPAFEAIGIGIERGEFDGFDAVMATQNFARTSAPLRPDDGAEPPAGPAPSPAEPPAPPPVDPAPDGGAGSDGGGEGLRLVGTGRSETLVGGAGADVIAGRGGNDVLRGGAGDDRLMGENGNDRLEGGVGRDVLIGGAGADVLRGGRSADAFVFDADDGRDVIRDFEDGADVIRLVRDGDGPVRVWLGRQGDDAVVGFGDTVIVLEDIALDQIDRADFELA